MCAGLGHVCYCVTEAFPDLPTSSCPSACPSACPTRGSYPPLQICSNPARRSSITRGRVEIWSLAYSNFLCTSSLVHLLLWLQTESPWKGWEADADRGGVAVGKEEQPRGQKKLMRPLLLLPKASRGSFAEAGPEAHTERSCVSHF